ncbi:SGNH/GDSL hydrolase family protein [Pseudoxanthomonas sp.]|uniref:SGNH/GDSL hydrolase family protein n=1 Tax=Pseudoxanthomonas sp. TaxID=1871049 RepID=UPI002633989B|nr:SGNH/GDSL hydrolase family protein [Pseudoxanthomonas sp.]WDS37496.1 MAG: SGNH/GDSL hydrolase family protein [Pseudoxanthomonas sp.]
MASLLVAALAGCAQAPVASVPPAAQVTQPVTVAPEVASGAVSNAAWARDMDDFATQDAANPPPRDAVLFIGSSSIRKWTSLAQDFAGTPVINRGFGGSEVRDSTYYADRIVVPYKPREVVFYAGDNDLNSGRSVQQVVDDTFAFIARVRHDLPGVPFVYISIKPSPSRVELLPKIRQVNAQIAQRAAQLQDVHYVDVLTPMLTPDGQLRPELFQADMLHMKPEGYALWTRLLKPYVVSKPH